MDSQANLHQPDLNGILNRMNLAVLFRRKLDKQTHRYRYRERTIITQKRSTWSRGKLYLIEGQELFLVPTNYPTVNYLNLEEFTFGYPACNDCDCFCPVNPIYDLTSFILIKRPNPRDYSLLNPLVEDLEDRVLRNHFENYRVKFLKDMDRIIREYCCLMIQDEHKIASLLSLQKQWDTAKYMKLLQAPLEHDLCHWLNFSRDYRLGIFLEVLIACCEDSLVIAEAATKMCRIYPDIYLWRYTLIHQTQVYIFFHCHIQLANLKDTRFVGPRLYVNILYDTFIFGDIEIMKLALELESWLGYTNTIGSILSIIQEEWPEIQFSTDPALWPRDKDEMHKESFYSVEFYLSLSYVSIWVASMIFHMRSNISESSVFRDENELCSCSRNIMECFQLFWRAIPTPYLPIEDMQQAIDLGKMEPYLSEEFHGAPEVIVWTAVAELFEDDFPSEFRPRSLKHLSRYAIRRLIRSPEQISSLHIPGDLKKYLLLES